MRTWICVVLLLTFLSRANATEAPKLVAVLPLDSSNAKLDHATKMGLEESIRTVVGDHLSARGYTVLTGDNTLQILTENGVDPTRVCDATCALNAARELKANLFISGSIAQTEGDYLAFVRLYDPKSGRQLASVKLEGKKVKELRAQFEAQAGTFIEKALRSSSEGNATATVPRSEGVNRTTAAAAEKVPLRKTGELSKDEVRGVITRRMNEVRYCYEKELRKSPSLAGRVMVRFTIGASGDVENSEIKSSELNNTDVESCITAKIRRWSFPAPRGGGSLEVSYPFVFRPAG